MMNIVMRREAVCKGNLRPMRTFIFVSDGSNIGGARRRNNAVSVHCWEGVSVKNLKHRPDPCLCRALFVHTGACPMDRCYDVMDLAADSSRNLSHESLQQGVASLLTELAALW